MKFIDFFAGVGGFRRGMELAGHECVGFCEWDKFATASYTSMHLITEDQRKSLAELTMKQRQKEILKEEYRNGEWYAGDIRAVSGTDLPRADCWCFGAPCFTAGTLITTHRGLVPIEEIQAGDLVLTHKNRFRKVITPMINVKRGIYTIKVQGSPKTEVTGNHRFFVRDKTQKWNKEKRSYEIIISEPYWKEVRNFNGNELIQFTVNHEDNNVFDLTEEECWILGRYIADGYIRNDDRKDRPSKNQKVIFCIGKHKKEVFVSHCKEIAMHPTEERTTIKYITGNKKLFSLCMQCGRGAENKIIPQFIMDLSPNMLKIFLDGYLSGDGSLSNGVWKATSISHKLIYQLGQCVMKAYGVGYSIYYSKRPKQCMIEGRTVNQKDTWHINFRLDSQKTLAHYIDGSIWMPIKQIEYNGKRQEIVYNMEVEDDNSYTANNMGVHNCQSFSLAGKRAGLAGESGLVREIFRLLNELKEEDRPEWLIYENVKGMFSSNRGWDYAAILSEMDRLGYDIEWQNINSKWFVPQNRERIYTIGHLRRFGSRKILPIEGASGENSIRLLGAVNHDGKVHQGDQIYDPSGIACTMKATMYKSPNKIPIKIEQIGRIPNKTRQNPNPGRTYSIAGISPYLSTMAGGNLEPQIGLPCFVDMNYGAGIKLTENARTLQARYYKGISGRYGENSGVAIPINSSPELIGGIGEKNFGKQFRQGNRIYSSDAPAMCLTSQPVGNTGGNTYLYAVKTDQDAKRNDGIFVEMPEGFIVYAIWYEKEQCYITIRKLTPKECFRLQGWSDDYFEKATFVNSDSQLYKQAGNGVTVPVIHAIAKKMK